MATKFGEIDSMDSQIDKQDKNTETPKNEIDILLVPTPSMEEIKKKNQSKKDEDPILSQFKDAEVRVQFNPCGVIPKWYISQKLR